MEEILLRKTSHFPRFITKTNIKVDIGIHEMERFLEKANDSGTPVTHSTGAICLPNNICRTSWNYTSGDI